MYDKNEEVTWKDCGKLVTGFLKLAFWFKFLYFVGIFHILASCLSSDIEQKDLEQARVRINNFLDQKFKEADSIVKNGGRYLPRQYFEVLNTMNQIEDSVGVSGALFDSKILWIQKLMSDGPYYEDEFKAAQTWCKQQPRIKHKPKEHQPHVCSKYIHHVKWSNLLPWFWYIYQHMFPYVFFLLLIWVYQKKDSPTLNLKRPLSFIFFLIIHPIYMTTVIVRWWRENIRGFFANVELRRRKKNIFEKFSEEERLTIRTFARSAQTFRQFIAQAEIFGSRKHMAFAVVIAVIVISVSSKIQAQNTLFEKSANCVEIHHVYTVSVDHDVGVNVFLRDFIHEIYGWILQPISQVSVLCIKVFHFLFSNGYPQTREPVPIGY